MNRLFCIILISVTSLLLFSYSLPPKPHLIVGNWNLIESQRSMQLLSLDAKKYFIEQLAFSSDKITSRFALIEKKYNREHLITLGYSIFDPFDNLKTPSILFKDLCDEKTRIVFSIIELNKEYLKLKFEKEYSSDNILVAEEILVFERTAGPPENMPEIKTRD